MVPSSLNIKDGTNATLQVVTNGDPSGGLYNVKPLHSPYLLPSHTQIEQ